MDFCQILISEFGGVGWLELTKLLLQFATLLSIVIAYRAYRSNVKKNEQDRERDRDKELVGQLKNSLRWAYDVLTNVGREIPPKPDRINWLTSARHLLRAGDIAGQISSSTYRKIADEVEEYWRTKFYLALSDEALRKWIYFADQSQPEWPENIEISSALVIIDFSNWKADAVDPTDYVDRSALKKRGGLKGGAGRGLESYLCRFEEIKAQRKEVS
ncbi:MAG: hypothetical protein Q8J70_03130 [Thiobacillus sp.]|nr:hypothetical protein [Thiobacillus sp.]